MALAVLLVACERPVTRPVGGSVVLVEVESEPAFVTDGTPFDVLFRVLGSPTETRYVLGGERFPCVPVLRGDGRSACPHPGLERAQFAEGPIPIFVEAVDGEGEVAQAQTTVTLDLTCPRAITTRLDPGIAEAGQTVSLELDASEELQGPPRVSRLGRDWGLPEGEGRQWRLDRILDAGDPALDAPVIVVLTDRAGNRNTDCGQDIVLPFAVDQRPPVVDPNRVLVRREAPGIPTVLTASAGAFSDDVAVVEISVLDADGVTLASLTPRADGGLDSTSLGLQTSTRLQLEARDGFGRTSRRVAVREEWQISLGTGSFPGVALRTGVRLTAPPIGTRSMRERTVEAAPDVARADARALVVRANVGFERVGTLPSFYEDVNRAYVGYEPTTDTILSIGGYEGTEYRFFDEYVEDVLALRWDEREGEYLVERLEPLSFEDPAVPPPGYGVNIAFDAQGCGVIYGGDQRVELSRAFVTSNLWQLCATPAGYQWTQIPVPETLAGQPLNRFAPIVWDPTQARYATVGGTFIGGPQVVFIEPAARPEDWRVEAVEPLPTSFVRRSGGYLYFDPRLDGFSYGLGGAAPIGNGEQRIQWSYVNGRWQVSDTPLDLNFYGAFGFAFDEARGQTAFWGGGVSSFSPPFEDVWYLTGTATSGPSAWRRARVEIPTPRDYPSMVYDPDRQVTLMFGGTNPSRIIAPEIHQLISQPAFPFVQVEIELGAGRPKGIEVLELDLQAAGLGDADGVGPETEAGAGVSVILWDYERSAWEEVAGQILPPGSGMTLLRVRLDDRPERFVADSGELAVALRSAAPATEARSARLELDLFDGRLRLRPGVTLP